MSTRTIAEPSARTSPQVLFYIAIEGRLLRPAKLDEDTADDLFLGWRDGLIAAVKLIIAFAIEEIDEMVLDGLLQMFGHVVVHRLEAERHAHGLAAHVARAVGLLHLGVPEIDAGGNRVLLGDIVLQETVQAMFPERALIAVTDSIFSCLLAEKLFSVFDCSDLVFHVHYNVLSHKVTHSF